MEPQQSPSPLPKVGNATDVVQTITMNTEPTPVSISKKLTHKQRKFVKEFVATEGNGTQAALAAYDTNDAHVAAAIASENLTKPAILNALENALPDELLAKIHREGLFSTKPIYDKEGSLIGEDADFNARHKYLETAYKLKGSFAPEKRLNVNVEVEASPVINDLTKKLNDIYRSGEPIHQRASGSSDGGTSGTVGTQAPDTK